MKFGLFGNTQHKNNAENNEAKAKIAALDRSLAIIEFDPSGNILDANDNFLNVMGYSHAEVVGHHHSMFLSQQEQGSSEYQIFWQKLRDGEFQQGEFHRLAKDGSDVWIQATYNPVLDDQGRVLKVIKFASDVTAQKLQNFAYEEQINAISRSQAVIHFNIDGTILWANDNFLNTMGYRLSEIKGKHHRIFLTEEDAGSEAYRSFWQKLQQGKFQTGEFKRQGKDREVWIQASYNPINDTHGKPVKVVKFASDITEEKQRNSNNQGKIEAINKSQAVIEFNMDGTIITANDNFLSTMGYKLDEIEGQHHRIFVEPGYAESNEYQQFWQSLRNGKFASAEYRRFAKDGQEVWIQAIYNPILDDKGIPVKVMKIATDITKQKQENADYEGQLRAISLSQAVIEFDLDGHILSANDNFLNAMGYTLDEVKGKHHRIFVAPEERDTSNYKSFWQALKSGKFQSGEYRRIGKQGQDVYIQASYNPILNAAGKPVKVVKYASDITEEKQRNADYQGQINAISKSQAVIEFNMDGTIITANEAFLSRMGYTLEEVKGQHHRMFIDSKSTPENDYRQFWAKLNEGQFQAGEYKRVAKSGEDVWIQASYNPIMDLRNRPVKVVKYATDVTEQKIRNANYQGQIEAIHKSQAVIEFNMDGIIRSANQHFLDAMGYRMDEIEGKHHKIFVSAEYANSPEYQQFWQSLNEGQFASGEYHRIGNGGHSVYIQATYNPILDANGTPYKVVKFCTDITGRVIAIDAASQSLKALASGDLDCAIEVEFISQFEELKEAINNTVYQLRQTVETINDSAEQVAAASNEIRLGNEDLSSRTEQQASSLEETAASMEELTSTVQANSNLSRDANKEAYQAKVQAENGADVVNKAVTSMEEINVASQKIHDIIGVIDEIAFQTNLLALNAAVEAARAGEEGRGFAVVANEVRSLAQRSAGAAKEIKALINSTVSKVEEGSKLVGDSGKTLAEIEAAISKVSEMVNQISEASKEQSAGIQEANEAITNMDTMTQQNAALVEEASAASQSLTDQANAMKQQLAFFTLRK
ncbi:MAG: PAS domain-containing protein [Aestuariibacter sp.]